MKKPLAKSTIQISQLINLFIPETLKISLVEISLATELRDLLSLRNGLNVCNFFENDYYCSTPHLHRLTLVC